MAAILSKKGMRRQGMKEVSDELSLNKEMEMEDIKAVERVLKSNELREVLEHVWVCGLDHGDNLFNDRMDMDGFIKFARASGLAGKGREGNVDEIQFSHLFSAVVGNSKYMYFDGFVRLLFHVGGYKLEIADRVQSIKMLLDKFLKKFTTDVYMQNDHDGCIPGEQLRQFLDGNPLNTLVEIDRLLFIYDLPLTKMFNKYRVAYKHQGRTDLSFEQLKLLDETVELEEFKECMKDFGMFPKHLAFVDMARIMSWVCFNRDLENVQKRSKEEQRGADEPEPQPEPEIDTRSEVTSNSIWSDTSAIAAMDKMQFFEAITRVAQLIFSKAPYNKRLATLTSRCEQLLKCFEPFYFKIFGVNIIDDCDFTTKGLPKFVSLNPIRGHVEGGYDISIIGSNFCEKRGVWVKFNNVLVKSKQIKNKSVLVKAPTMQPDSVYVDLNMSGSGVYVINIFKVCNAKVEISNDKREFTESDPPIRFMFELSLPAIILEEELQTKLQKMFVTSCSQGDRYNTKYMNKEKWRKFKKEHGIVEPIQKFPDKEDETKWIVEEEPYFADLNAIHDLSKQQLTIDFNSLLRIIIKILAEKPEVDVVGGLTHIVRNGDKYISSGVQEQATHQEDEISSAKAQIRLIQHRSIRQLDIYCGPVLVGTIHDRPGYLTGLTNQQYKGKRHSFITYHQYDINIETKVLNHLSMSESFRHLLNRLLMDGFDFATPAEVSTRKPVGRCWSILHQNVKIGSMWDYEGNFSNLDWQPADVDTTNKHCTMCIYKPDEDFHFINAFICFTKSKDIVNIRNLLQQSGYTTNTVLYRP